MKREQQQQRALIDEWLLVHRALMAAETAFTELAMQAAAGELSVKDLNRERTSLMQLRAKCTAAYAKAFPSGTVAQ